jgi:hypothetical protein
VGQCVSALAAHSATFVKLRVLSVEHGRFKPAPSVKSVIASGCPIVTASAGCPPDSDCQDPVRTNNPAAHAVPLISVDTTCTNRTRIVLEQVPTAWNRHRGSEVEPLIPGLHVCTA